jgi:ribosomal protein S18 acetylase RimI-like enzyme
MSGDEADDWFNRPMADEEPLRLRLGTDGDVEKIAHVHRLSRAWYYGTEADPDDGREAMWAHLIAQPGRKTHVAERSDRMVGFVSAVRAEDLEATLNLTALYVLPECVGVGVGPRLYEQFDADRRDGDTGLLEVWSGNARATNFYVRRGWTPTTTSRPGPQNLDFVLYRLAPKSQPD